MARSTPFIFLIYIFSLNCVASENAAKKNLKESVHWGLALTTWTEKTKTNVNQNIFSIRIQATGIELSYPILNQEKSDTEFLTYSLNLSYSKGNAESYGDFTFKQTDLSIYGLGARASYYLDTVQKVKLGLNIGLFDRVILFQNIDPTIEFYDTEKILIEVGFQTRAPLTSTTFLTSQFNIIIAGQIKWSIGFIF